MCGILLMMPTPKQKKAVIKIVENSLRADTRPLGELLREVGYSPNTAVKPHQVTRSEGFLKLLNEYFPDDKLMKVAEEGLSAWKRSANGEIDDDFANRFRYLKEIWDRKHGPTVATPPENNTQINIQVINYNNAAKNDNTSP